MSEFNPFEEIYREYKRQGQERLIRKMVQRKLDDNLSDEIIINHLSYDISSANLVKQILQEVKQQNQNKEKEAENQEEFFAETRRLEDERTERLFKENAEAIEQAESWINNTKAGKASFKQPEVKEENESTPTSSGPTYEIIHISEDAQTLHNKLIEKTIKKNEEAIKEAMKFLNESKKDDKGGLEMENKKKLIPRIEKRTLEELIKEEQEDSKKRVEEALKIAESLKKRLKGDS